VIDFAAEDPRFEPGDCVVHRRYGYRGVVVAVDPRCLANEEWYQRNRTQPERNQAWYHVLVHDATHTTYAAEQSLLPDPDPAPVSHPLVNHFFSAYVGGKHVRNDRPWPGMG